eukprot:TRINITY_DN5303_c0_g1_i1.p1 TRINITY_DN5303_c0_g1~~TRINITY_DN5303_c0_g1_i1.p1  ORF type:complete len:344 (+),score=34.86 TRINITY_DN5303_c0_g1_i1:194-1225(+)
MHLSVLVFLSTLCLLSATVGTAEGEVQTFVFGPFFGGKSNCALCGEPGQYRCLNPNQTLPLTFIDHSNLAYFAVSKVDVQLRGSFGCTQGVPNVIEVNLNGVVVNVLQTVPDQNACACNTCGGNLLFTTAPPSGLTLPNYNSDGVNNLEVLGYSGSFCLNTVEVTVTYAKIVPDGSAVMYNEYNVASDNTVGPNAICGRNPFTTYSGIGVNDPLPAGSVVQTIAVQLFGKFFSVPSFETECQQQINGSLVVNDRALTPENQVYSRVVEANVFGGCSSNCDGLWTFTNSQVYANGFPGYGYGITNTYSWKIAGPSIVSRVAVWLYYTPPANVMPAVVQLEAFSD